MKPSFTKWTLSILGVCLLAAGCFATASTALQSTHQCAACKCPGKCKCK